MTWDPQVHDPERLEPQLARLLGDGSDVLTEASATACAEIEPVHFLGHLARAGGAIVRVELLESRGVRVEAFCENLYETALDEDRRPGVPLQFGLDALSEASRELWRDFAAEIDRRDLQSGTEALFTLVLLRHLPSRVNRLLRAVVGSEEALDAFHGALERRATGVERRDVFDEDVLLERTFDASGRRLLDRLQEETASLGGHKATTLHLLYAMVGLENGSLQRALSFQAIDPMKEVHAVVGRELARPGARRVRDFELRRDSLHASVVQVLESAAAEAERQAVPVAEVHVARALVAPSTGVVAELLRGRKVNLESLRDYLAHAEDEDEGDSELLRLPVAEIEAELGRRLLGQDHAIRRIMPWIKRLRFGFPRERGAAAVLLFLGPSGTGKTQLAKELARAVYGSEEELIMLEMGQFNSKESINLFIGSPPGYVGYGEGQLTNGLRDRPRSVVLFDEVEKAHEDVWVALLRFLDEGMISDPAGPVRDGRQCIVVLTSNLGASTLAKRIPAAGDDADSELEEAIRSEVLKYLKRPEIYNRVDDKVVFRPFDHSTYRLLVERFVEREGRKFEQLSGTRVEIGDGVIDFLTERAYDQREEGARCVPRLVNRHVVAPIIDLLTREDSVRAVPEVVVSRRGEGTVVEEA